MVNIIIISRISYLCLSGTLAEEKAQDDVGLVPVRGAFFPSISFAGTQVKGPHISYMTLKVPKIRKTAEIANRVDPDHDLHCFPSNL